MPCIEVGEKHGKRVAASLGEKHGKRVAASPRISEPKWLQYQIQMKTHSLQTQEFQKQGFKFSCIIEVSTHQPYFLSVGSKCPVDLVANGKQKHFTKSHDLYVLSQIINISAVWT